MNEPSIFDDDSDESDDETTGLVDAPLDDDRDYASVYEFDDTTHVGRLLEQAKDEVHAADAAETLQRTQAGHQAKAALKELYDDDFDFDAPPDSLDRYERVLALREMEHAAISNARRESEIADEFDTHDLPNVQHAVQVVSIMESYGELAEHNLARVAGATVARAEVREAAAASLKLIRKGAATDSHDSIREALAAWLRPGDS